MNALERLFMSTAHLRSAGVLVVLDGSNTGELTFYEHQSSSEVTVYSLLWMVVFHLLCITPALPLP